MKKSIKKIALMTSAIISVMALAPVSAEAAWKKNDVGWWYTEGDSYATGWKYIDGNWYYFYSDGYMATDYKIGDYFVNSQGVWTEEITADDALQLIWNEDKDYITNEINNDNAEFPKYLGESSTSEYSRGWYMSDYEDAYDFGFYDKFGDIVNEYLVGKQSKNVYIFPNQGNCSAYQIKDGKKLKTFKFWEGKSSDWRK